MPSKGKARRARRERNGSLQSNQNLSELVPQPCTTTSTLGAWGKGPPQENSNFEEYTGSSSNSACSSVANGAWRKGPPVKVETEPLLTDSEKTSNDDGFTPRVKEYLEKESNSGPTMLDFVTETNLIVYLQNLTAQQRVVFDAELAKTGIIQHAIMTVRGDCKLGEGPGNLGRGEGQEYTTLSNGFANPNSSEMRLLFGCPDYMT